MLEYLVIMAIGALASVLSNQGVAVFNDGLRPLFPQYFEGKISRKQLATMSFAISFGLVIGFAIPTSISSTIILIHSILLATDIIGVFCPDNFKGMILSAIIGAIYGALLLLGLTFVVDTFELLPFDFLSSLSRVSAPVVVTFAIFPSVAIAYQHGFKKGFINAFMTILVFFMVRRFGTFTFANHAINLNAEGVAMFVGMVLMIAFASQVKGTDEKETICLTAVFANQVSRIQKNWWLLALMGGLIAVGTSLSIVAGDPISLGLLAERQTNNAGMAAFARAIGFVPLVFTTAIVTGVYGKSGCTLVFVVGLFLSGNPVLAFIIGAVVMSAEAFLIQTFAKMMDKFPGIREMGEHIRTSMNKVLELALLVGAATATESMVPGVGPLFVIGYFLLNKSAKKPIVDLAVGPVAVITFGILVNILVVIDFYVVPAVL